MGVITGAITWTEQDRDGYLYATIVATDAKRTTVAAPLGSDVALMLEDARVHGDQLFLRTVRNGINLANVHAYLPRDVAIEAEITWRTPRLGSDAPFGVIARDNVITLQRDDGLAKAA